ncbi:NUDIX hydrolase domain-like protein [Metarhizium guizhouense ARSEF 977]|uniref:NUDIX hydrolase domain-like protein n=1 Tax=Metarhizium guizhouense (strain ARSEF 977) TaxID=1276136 RepID=A0A0B4H1D5_METGA|nr:NUDIX hydrolase domain-like protein [Metarhizium guizhouense ARSEF 977]
MIQSKEGPVFGEIQYNEEQYALTQKQKHLFYRDNGEIILRDSEELKKYPVHPDYKHVRTGVSTLIMDTLGWFIFDLRKQSHGPGTISLYGGHVEIDDDTLATVQKEVDEESGLQVKCRTSLGTSRDNFASDIKGRREYLTNVMAVEPVSPDATPEICEPNKSCGHLKLSPRMVRVIMQQAEIAYFAVIRNLLAVRPAMFRDFALQHATHLKDPDMGEGSVEEELGKDITAMYDVLDQLMTILNEQQEQFPEGHWEHLQSHMGAIEMAIPKMETTLREITETGKTENVQTVKGFYEGKGKGF